MLAKVIGCAIVGLDAKLVEVEVGNKHIAVNLAPADLRNRL